jgi:post-segregation antitoxin (ccd killing protein)
LRALEIVMIDLDVSGGIQACIRTETHRSWSDRWQSDRWRTVTGGLRWQTRGWRPPQRL